MQYIAVLSIAGSDCSGGAGIQADLKTISALGGYAATAITAITVQNTTGVRNIHPVPANIVRGQIEAVMDDIRPQAIKIGMVNDVPTIHTIACCLRHYPPTHIVFDPVMVSTSGHRLIQEDAINAITSELMPLATLITPNLREAEVLCGRTLHTDQERQNAAYELLRYGSKAVLLKGGHLEGNAMTDLLVMKGTSTPLAFTAKRIDSNNTHGTGCTLSSAIATLLAQGLPLPQAVEQAKAYVHSGIEHGRQITIGNGHGPLNHFFAPVPLKIID